MKRLLAAGLFMLCLAAQACASAGPAASLSVPAPATALASTPTEYVPTPIPVTPTSTGCAFMSGSQELPNLSRQLNAEVQKISLDVTGLAYAYGEKCVYGDGHETFTAVETDFRIGVKVLSVKDEATLGDWIYKVMNIVLDLPADQLQGTQPGRVDFGFKQPDPAALFVTVPIEKYRNEADDLRGADLLHLFLSTP